VGGGDSVPPWAGLAFEADAEAVAGVAMALEVGLEVVAGVAHAAAKAMVARQGRVLTGLR